MATLDISELLDDPEFCDPLTYDRRTQAVGANGRASFATVAGTQMIGSVQPGGEYALKRGMDAAQPGEWIVIYTATILLPHNEATGVYGDVVNWKGRRYQVRMSDDWQQFGAGYSKALAELIPAGAP